MVGKSGGYLSSILVSLAALLGQAAISASVLAAVTCDFAPPPTSPQIKGYNGLLTCFDGVGPDRRIAYAATFDGCVCGTTIGSEPLSGIQDPGDVCKYPIWIGPGDRPSRPNFTCDGSFVDWPRYDSSNPRPYARTITYVNPRPNISKPSECTQPPAPLNPLDPLLPFNPPDGCPLAPQPSGMTVFYMGGTIGGSAGSYPLDFWMYYEGEHPKWGQVNAISYRADHRSCPYNYVTYDAYRSPENSIRIENHEAAQDVCQRPIYRFPDDLVTPGLYANDTTDDFNFATAGSLESMGCGQPYRELVSVKRRISWIAKNEIKSGDPFYPTYFEYLGLSPGQSLNLPLPSECDGTPSQPEICHNPYVGAGNVYVDEFGYQNALPNPYPPIVWGEEKFTPACPGTPQDCQWSEWSDYGACSANACGTSGTRTRTRTIASEALLGGAACTGPATESISCEAPACEPVDCLVGDFGAFGACSANACGTTGVKTQTRNVLTYPSNGGQECPSLSNSISCDAPACPVDCMVSPFVDSGTCSKTCGGGTKTQVRTVLTPASNGGLACPSNLSQTVSCNTQACPPPPPPSKLAGSCDFSGVRLLWPPNNKMVTIGRVTLAPGAYLEVYSDERTSSKGHDDDRDKYGHGDDHKKKYGSSQNKNYSGGQCNGNDDDDDDYYTYDASLIKGVFSLRATRLGYGDGRVYLAAIKGNGLTTVNCGTVVVPHDQSQRSLNSARSQGTTAASFLRSSGLPPANFFKLEVKK